MIGAAGDRLVPSGCMWRHTTEAGNEYPAKTKRWRRAFNPV